MKGRAGGRLANPGPRNSPQFLGGGGWPLGPSGSACPCLWQRLPGTPEYWASPPSFRSECPGLTSAHSFLGCRELPRGQGQLPGHASITAGPERGRACVHARCTPTSCSEGRRAPAQSTRWSQLLQVVTARHRKPWSPTPTSGHRALDAAHDQLGHKRETLTFALFCSSHCYSDLCYSGQTCIPADLPNTEQAFR